jgi:hypothetical protein
MTNVVAEPAAGGVAADDGLGATVVGFVEQMEPSAIRGWALSQDGARVALALRIDGRDHPLEPVWVERGDVAGHHGAEFLISGYRCALDRHVAGMIREALLAGRVVEVCGNGVVLPCIGQVPAAETLLEAEPLLINLHSPERRAVLESWGHFSVSGWALVGNAAPAGYKLVCNGAELDCTALVSERLDVAQALGVLALDTGFEIELPGCLWEFVPQGQDARINILAGEHVLSAEPIILDRARAAGWIADICRMHPGQERQYRMLLALEHVHFGQLGPLLEDDVRASVREFAERMHLGAFIAGEELGSWAVPQLPVDADAPLRMWGALRALNARLTGTMQPMMADVRAVIREYGLEGELRESFLLAALPLLCKTGEFPELRDLLDFSRLKRFDSSYDLWEMSLTPPAHVLDGDVQRATEILWRMSRHLHKGWLNTECVRFTLEHTLRLEAEGKIEPAVAEGLRWAVIGLLDAFGGEWFSRLHDHELVEALVSMLAASRNYSDSHRQEIAAAAIRLYGLNPAFWQRISMRRVELCAELQRAQAAWGSIREAFGGTLPVLQGRVDDVVEALDYFQRKYNPEASLFLREGLAGMLASGTGDLNPSATRLAMRTLDHSPLEAARIAASPLAREGLLQEGFPGVARELRDRLRLAHYHAKSPVHALQCEGAALLRDIGRQAEDGSPAALSAAVSRLTEVAMLLGDRTGLFLGADLLAQMLLLPQSLRQLDRNLVLSRVQALIRAAIAETSPNSYLPLPVQTALVTLAAVAKDQTHAAAHEQLLEQVRERFGERHEALLDEAEDRGERSFASRIWPADTLVAIYSCRKYMDTRVAAIRASWVQDLVARGIPYVVVVGDGDDTLNGDVLALDVSDRYEDLPKKSLKLFEWIHRHTAAQFVLKIDDDCYLDVDRYFDSLSHRKHAYYGRVLFRKEGGMDRLWHQAKSLSAHSRKSIDKSPEPSIYADGGGAYSLSRLAMAKLLEMAESDAGKRLIASSFMEDKLVGDLLTLAGIQPSDEDYESYQRRRTFGDAMPVSIWENTFFPSALTPTKVVHLDTEKDLQWVRSNARGEALWPKKLWPTCWNPAVVTNSNQLELLSEPSKAAALLQHELVAVVVVRNEMTMLPHFLAHYRKLGIACFVFIDNCSDDGSREFLHGQEDVVLFSADTEYKESFYGVAWQQAVMGNLCLGKWVLLADADEFLVYEGCEERPLTDFLAQVDAEGADAVQVDMVDMYPAGDLAEADFGRRSPFEAAPWFDSPPLTPWHLGSGWFSNSTGFVSHLRHRLLPTAVPADFVSQKYALFRYRPWVRVSQGLHYASNLRVSGKPCWFAHFKYHAGFKDKVAKEIQRAQHFNNAAEYRRYAALFAEGRGGFGDPQWSRRYEGSASFVSIHASMRGANDGRPHE